MIEKYQSLWGEEPTAPSVSGSATSRAAADEITPHLGRLQKLVLNVLAQAVEGLTDEEIQLALGMDGSTERPRRVWLTQKGFVEDSGNKKRTRSGRLAVVWRWTGKNN